MILAKVTGRIEATQKSDVLRGCNLLLVTAIGDDLTPVKNKTYVAVDQVGAGRDDLVLINESLTLHSQQFYTLSIVAIVEKVHQDR